MIIFPIAKSNEKKIKILDVIIFFLYFFYFSPHFGFPKPETVVEVEEDSIDKPMATATRPGVPKSAAISKGYNFASTWEQVHPLFSFFPFFTVITFSPDLLDLSECITKVMFDDCIALIAA